MPRILTNGVNLSYQRTGEGAPVLFIMGSNASGQVWTVHQTPALAKAGYESVTFDNRGIPPSDVPPGRYSLDDMVADTRGLIEKLSLGPCRIVATSLGGTIALELAIDHPELVRCAVLIATRARLDPVRSALARGECELIESGVLRPPVYEAATQALHMLSPATLNNPDAASTWLDLFELSAAKSSGASGQAWADLVGDRREALRGVTAHCRVIAFADDLMVPPYLCAEVAEAIPNCDLVRLTDCGHFGFLERPDDVNAAIIEFLDAN